MRYYFASLFFFISLPVLSQIQKKDSLLHVLSTQSLNEAKTVSIYNKLAHIYLKLDIDSTQYYANKALALSQKLHLTSEQGRASMYLGQVAAQKQNFLSAETLTNQAIHLFESVKDTQNLIRAYIYLSTCYDDKTDYVSAYKYALTAKNLAESKQNDTLLGVICSNMGILNFRWGYYDVAVQLFEKGIESKQRLNILGLAPEYINLTTAYLKLNQYPKAKLFAQKAIEHGLASGNKVATANAYIVFSKTFHSPAEKDSCRFYSAKALAMAELSKDSITIIAAWEYLGVLQIDNEEWDAAKQSITKTYRFFYAKKDMKGAMINSLINLAIIEKHFGNSSLAIQYAKEAIEIGKKLNLKSYNLTAWELLENIYKEQNDYKHAYEALENVKILSDSLAINEATLKLEGAKVSLLVSQNNAKIESLQNSQAEQLDTISTQKLYLILLLVFSAGLMILSFLLSRYLTFRTKTNTVLSLKNVEIQSQKDQLSNINDLKDKLIFIISHDLKGPFTTLQGIIYLIEKQLISEKEGLGLIAKVKQEVNLVAELLDNLVVWSRSQTADKGDVMQKCELYQAVNKVIDLYSQDAERKQITLKNNCEKQLIVHTHEGLLHLVLRNILSNAIKFTHNGGAILFYQKIVGTDIQIIIEDNGIGMTPTQIEKIFTETRTQSYGTQNEKGVGLGLFLSREAIKQLGGTIVVESMPDEGSKFIVSLPFPTPRY